MDLGLYRRVLWRFRSLLAVGVALAIVLSVLAYYRVELGSGMPTFTPRKDEAWQAQSTLFMTQRGFPAGQLDSSTNFGQLIGLAPLYARLANSDEVKKRMRRSGPLDGEAEASPTADTSYGVTNGLPMITIFGRSTTGPKALTVTRRATSAFLRYLDEQQAANAIPRGKRVVVTVLNAPGKVTLIEPRKKTLPIVVFLGVLSAVVGLAFILENARLNAITRAAPVPEPGPRRAPVPTEEPEPAATIEPVRKRRWA